MSQPTETFSFKPHSGHEMNTGIPPSTPAILLWVRTGHSLTYNNIFSLCSCMMFLSMLKPYTLQFSPYTLQFSLDQFFLNLFISSIINQLTLLGVPHALVLFGVLLITVLCVLDSLKTGPRHLNKPRLGPSYKTAGSCVVSLMRCHHCSHELICKAEKW